MLSIWRLTNTGDKLYCAISRNLELGKYRVLTGLGPVIGLLGESFASVIRLWSLDALWCPFKSEGNRFLRPLRGKILKDLVRLAGKENG
jgi:hypothetical protein